MEETPFFIYKGVISWNVCIVFSIFCNVPKSSKHQISVCRFAYLFSLNIFFQLQFGQFKIIWRLSVYFGSKVEKRLGHSSLHIAYNEEGKVINP